MHYSAKSTLFEPATPRTKSRDSTGLFTPWKLLLGRDGTEDYLEIHNGVDECLATSRFFWMPEGEDPVPETSGSMIAMCHAPAMLQSLQSLIHAVTTLPIRPDDPLAEALVDAREVAAAATNTRI